VEGKTMKLEYIIQGIFCIPVFIGAIWFVCYGVKNLIKQDKQNKRTPTYLIRFVYRDEYSHRLHSWLEARSFERISEKIKEIKIIYDEAEIASIDKIYPFTLKEMESFI
jgi:hypothetical protein